MDKHGKNYDVLIEDVEIVDKTTGTKIATATDQKLSVYGVTPVVQQSKINDPSGQATDLDAEARTAINAILDAIEAFGITASS